jgi:hypothetical protein
MITNATLTQIDIPGDASPAGEVDFTDGETIAVRCCIEEPSFNQRFTITDLELGQTSMIYVPIAMNDAIPTGARMTVMQDQEDQAFVFIARRKKMNVKSGGLSHLAIFAEAA